jgi:antitoxin component YwqK of YwqJK toxin-antitoxin module
MRLLKITLLLFLGLLYKSSFACTCIAERERPMQIGDLEMFGFVAHVRVISEREIKSQNSGELPSQSLLAIDVVEQFKGNKFSQIIENDINSSCDMGVDAGEEWVVFATLVNDRPVISACQRNIQFKAKDGKRDWQFQRGFWELNELRALYGHASKHKPDGKKVEYYPNGKIEMEEYYANGAKNGDRTVFYPNGVIYGREKFINDSLQGESRWYFPSGQLAVRRFFERGKPRNITRAYYDSTIEQTFKKLLIRDFYKTEDSLRFVYNRIQVHAETVFDSYGRQIAYRRFSRLGQSEYESLTSYAPNLTTQIFYHENGNIQSIGYTKDYNNYGHYQQYDENGVPNKSWEYDPQGRQVKSSIWIKK